MIKMCSNEVPKTAAFEFLSVRKITHFQAIYKVI